LDTHTHARTMANSKGRSKKTFRGGEYYAHVWAGKRTVKEGECAAVWLPSGKRNLVQGPQRVRLYFSHVRFLDRHVADNNQFLKVQYRDGRREHRRGPVAQFFDPCVHQEMKVLDAYRLAANEALVVYREEFGSGRAGELVECTNGKSPEKKGDRVVRTIVKGPAVYFPEANEWVHTFSWHGSVTNGKGSQTGRPGDEKQPHALSFQKLRCMPDQMYFTVRDVRTSDDAQIQIHLMIFYELTQIERMLDATNDPIGDFINALSADVMKFGAANTYESMLQRTTTLGDVATYPTVTDRMKETGFRLLKVVYRGYSTSGQLQAIHDEAIAKRTRLRLQQDTAAVEQEEQAMQLRCKQERSHQEQEVAEAAARHSLSLLTLKEEQGRSDRDADHAQALRHLMESAETDVKAQRMKHDEELRRYEGLKAMGVDLTKYLCTVADQPPDQHIRIDSATPPALHMEMKKSEGRKLGPDAKKGAGIFGI